MSRRALVVEDDEDIRDVLNTLLAVLGFEVRESTNGADALDVLRQWLPDLIVLDMIMPVMNGWAFRAEQKKIPELRDVPVIVLSARPPPWRNDDPADFATILPKPFELNAFLAAVSRHFPGIDSELTSAGERVDQDGRQR